MSAHAADNPLKLLKAESETTLRKIQQALESYLEDPEELEALDTIAALSNQIRGVFAILEQPDASAFMAEMKALVQGLKEGTVPNPETAREVLSEAVIQAPRYLDWLEREGRKPQFNLQPLTAKLRGARISVPAGERPAPGGADRADPRALAAKLRPTVQRAMLAVVKGKINRDGIKQIGKLFGVLKAAMHDEGSYRLWWLAESYFLEVAGGGIRPSRQDVNLLLRDLERQMHGVAEAGHLDANAEEVAKRLLAFLKASASGAKRLEQRVGFNPPQPEPEVPMPEPGPISAPPIDDATLDVIANHLKESVALAKDAIDRFARDEARNPAVLQDQLERLHHLANVLVMMNMDVASAIVIRQIDTFEQWIADSDSVDNAQILAMAGEIILVEDCLESLRDLVYSEEMAAGVAAELDDEGKVLLLTDFHHRRARSIVIRELMDAVNRAKDFATTHLDSSEETISWSDLSSILQRFGGSLLVLGDGDMPQLAWRLERIVGALVDGQIISDRTSFMNAFAEVLLGLENGLRVLAEEHTPGQAEIAHIQGQLQTLENLFQQPLDTWTPRQIEPVVSAVVPQQPATETAPEIGEPELDSGSTTTEEPVAEEPVAEEPVAEEPVAEEPVAEEPVPEEPIAEEDDEIMEIPDADPEFLEIFFEEALGEIESIDEQLLTWRSNLADQASLSSIRRSFHTLKGSGRMVGLTALGDFAWSYEQLLNRVLEGMLPASETITASVSRATAALGTMVKEGRPPKRSELNRLQALSQETEALLRGELPTAAPTKQLSKEAPAPEPVEQPTPEEPISELPTVESDEADTLASVPELPTLETTPAEEEPEEPVEPELPTLDSLLEETLESLPEEPEEPELPTLETTPAEEEPEEPAEPELPTLEATYDEEPVQTGPDFITSDESLVDNEIIPPSLESTDLPSLDKEAEEELTPLDEILEEDIEPSLATDSDDLHQDPGLAAFETLTEPEVPEPELPEEAPTWSTVKPTPEVEQFANEESGLPEDAPDLPLEVTANEEFPPPLDEEPVAEEPVAEEPVAEEDDEIMTLPDVDPEFLEIFFEEALGELESIDEQLLTWRANLSDQAALSSIRRSFHTLKGSGRMVGLSALGDFAWSYEQLLNRVLDGLLPTSEAIATSVGRGSAALGAMVREGRPPKRSELDQLQALSQEAEALLRGELPQSLAQAQTEAPVEEVTPSTPETETEEPPVEEPAVKEMVPEPPEFPTPVTPLPPGESPPESPQPPAQTTETTVATELDPELVEMFLYEATEILDAGDATLQQLSGDPENQELLNDLRREMHTLKGSGRMVGLLPIGDLAHAMESVLDGLGKGAVIGGGNPVEVLQQAMDGLSDMLGQVRAGQDLLPRQDLLEQLHGFLGTDTPIPRGTPTLRVVPREPTAEPKAVPEAPLPEPLGFGDSDQELVQTFLIEATEILDASEITLQRWISEPENQDLLNDLRRDMHTIKGSARMAGLTAIGDLAHAMESLFEAINAEKVTADAQPMETLQRSLDTLNTMVVRFKNGEPSGSADDRINEINELLGLEPVATQAPASVWPQATNQQLSKTSSKNKAAGGASGKPAADTDTIRVSATLMNNLINQMGESSIFRARVDQGVGAFRFNLSEMDQTVNRLRQQLRRLEIETEAQILFRYEDSRADTRADARAEFDPLELDRFSELQQLSRQLMEIVDDLANIETSMEDQAHGMGFLLDQQGKVNKEIQQGLMQTRMVQFSSIVPRLRRVVRQVAQEEGKRAELILTGSESEVDRSVLDKMQAPLEHMLRNSLVHGIESPAERKDASKPETGRINLDLRREGAELVLTLRDDGGGLNYQAIRTKAIEKGMMQEDAAPTEQELIAFMLQPGFSTAKRLSMVAGRGVGMDVINDAVKEMRGAMQIQSKPGQETKIIIRLPYSLAVTQALLVQAGKETYAVPLLSIEAVTRLKDGEMQAYIAGKTVMHRYGEHRYPMHSLAILFGGDSEDTGYETQDTRPPALLFRSAEASAALQVDAVLGNQEIIVKPVAPQLHAVPGISGATVLGDGRVVVVLELAALVRNLTSKSLKQAEARALHQARQETGVTKITAMVIDDSITMRKVMARFLERHGLTVTTAKDGVEAVAMLEEQVPNLAFLDIEMPRMDGFEVMAHVRNQPHLKHLPVIMVTSRSGEKHRERGSKLGVTDYLIKPYQEEEMIRSIRKVLREQGLELPST